VIREVISRLAAASVDNSNSSPFGRSSSKFAVADLCVNILKNICSSCRQGVFEVGNDLQEIFLYLTEFSPLTTKTLLTVLYPYFSFLPGLGDRCSISLRKASFSKDSLCRQAAASAIISLLHCHLKFTPNTSSSSSVMSNSRYQDSLLIQEKMKQKVAIGLPVEEIMVLLNRFLQHQSSVRSLVYKDLYQIAFEVPAFRPVCLRLLRGHFSALFNSSSRDDDSFNNHRSTASSPASESFHVSLDKFVDESGNIVENIKELVLVMLSITILSATSDTFVADIFSQSDRFQAISEGDSMTFTQTLCITNEKEAELTSETIWSFCLHLADVDLDDIFTSSPSSDLDITKLEALFSAYYTATVSINLVPVSYIPISLENRSSVLKQILKKMVVILGVVNKYKKSTKDTLQKASKLRKKISGTSIETDSIPGSNAKEERKHFRIEIDGDCGHILITEMQFISNALADVITANMDVSFPSQRCDEPFSSLFFSGKYFLYSSKLTFLSPLYSDGSSKNSP
jgi:hypothetical protein